MKFLISALLALFLTSCFEFEEEVWIHADGSGRLVIHQSMPSMALARVGDPQNYLQLIKDIDAEEDSLRIETLRFEVEGSNLIYELDAHFTNGLKLQQIFEKNKERIAQATGFSMEEIEALSGVTRIGLDGLSPTYERTISLASVIPAPVKSLPALLGSSSLRFTLHLPVQIRSSNALTLSEDQKTASWHFTLKEHLDEPIVMSLTTAHPIPWWLYLLFFFTLWFLFTRWRRWRRRRRTSVSH